MSERNERLRDLGMEPLQDVEILTARLYTGPMYCKYNTVLRDIGHLQHLLSQQTTKSATQSAPEISFRLKKYQEQKELEEMGKPLRERKGRGFPGHTNGNLYTTTLHVINSAVLKLGKLTQMRRYTYRGISFRTLAEQMKNRPRDSDAWRHRIWLRFVLAR